MVALLRKWRKGWSSPYGVIVRRQKPAANNWPQILDEKLRGASDRESAGQAAEFAPQADQVFRPK